MQTIEVPVRMTPRIEVVKGGNLTAPTMSSVPPRSNDVRRVTARVLAVIGGVGFAVGAVVGIVQYAVSSPECEPLREVPWTAARLDGIGASVSRAGKADAWPATRAKIEAFAARWEAAYVKACDLPEGAPRDAGYACLGASYTSASSLIDALKLLDPNALASAEETIDGLGSPESCVE